jgi:Leucine-rich repeat (LRR) protein
MDSRIEPNELVKQLIKENLSHKAPYLDLAFCGLRGDEPALEMLAECKHLKGLNMSDTPEEYDEEKDGWSLPDGRHPRQFNPFSNNIIEIGAIPDYLPTSLEYLCIGKTQDGQSNIKDIGNVARLTKLKRLNLNYNAIKDLSPLQWLPQLERLYLHKNYLEDLSPLIHLRQLWQLDIGNNDEIHDITPLSKLTKLRHLNANACSIRQLAPLQGIAGSLEILNLSYNNDEDLMELVPLNGLDLRKLDISGNWVNKLSYLSALGKLEVLTMEGCRFSEIDIESEEEYEENLEEYFEQVKFELPSLPLLKKLILNGCELESLTLPLLPELLTLEVAENQLTEFSPEMLARLPKLDELNLWGNPIENLPQELYTKTQECVDDIKAYFAQNK